jgi:myo-inositol-1(or 4)-monophosphatase
VQAAVAQLWGTREAQAVTGRGAGGDGTVYVDRLAEDTVLRILDEEHSRGRDFSLLSEEVGEKTYGAGGDLVIVDPIDGSVNAKMGIPYFSITLAAARGRDYGSVFEGLTRNLVTGDTYTAVRGGGALVNGEPPAKMPAREAGRFRVLQVEPTRLTSEFPHYAALLQGSEKVRMLGSAALNICLCASGTISVTVSPSLRSVDCVAPILYLEEAGGAVTDMDGRSLSDRDLGLDERISLVAGVDREAVDEALRLLALSASEVAVHA